MDDYTRLTPSGDRVVDLSRAGRDELAAVQEITVEDFMDGRGEEAREVRRVRFKLADKRAAIEQLNGMFGWKVDRSEVGPAGSMLPVETEEELIEKLVNMLMAKGMTEAQALEFLRDTESGEWELAPGEGWRRRDQH